MRASGRKIDVLIYILLFVICALFGVVSVLYRKNCSALRDAYRQYDAKVEIIEKCKDKIKSLERQLNGEREPSANCIGCKYLIISDVNPYNPFAERRYNCWKNLRCKEYEEEAGEKPCL